LPQQAKHLRNYLQLLFGAPTPPSQS
jgi:hypothetical protein